MFTATDLSILILIVASILVLVLDAIGNQQSKALLEKPHIGLVAFGALYIALTIEILESLSTTTSDQILFNSKIGNIFLVVNSLIALSIMRNIAHQKPSGSYFLILSSLAISMFSISTDSLIFKFIASTGWMTLLTTLAVISTPGGKKAEIGLKFSFSALLLIIQFILLLSFLYYENLPLNISDINLTKTAELSQNLITIFIILSGMSLAGIPPFHSGFIDCFDGGNIGVAFLLLSNASIQGCSLLMDSKNLLNNSSLSTDKFNTLGLILVLGFILLWARALDQSKIRRTTAYIAASISPLFSMTLLFGSSILLPKPIFIIATYAFITLSLSALFSSLSHMTTINQPWQTWEELSGFGRMNPWQTLVFLVGLSSIAGIPGTFGYFIKLSLIAPMQENFLFSSAIFLSIAIGAACLMRVFVFVFAKHSHLEQSINLPKPSFWLIAVSFILVGLGFFPFVS